MPPKLIGLTGHKRSGKDSIADVLALWGYERMAFADPLKSIASAIGWDGSKDETPRYCGHCGIARGRNLLQLLGTEGLRENLWSDVWIDAMEKRLTVAQDVVITDIRFPNEAEAVRRWGGTIWKVARPGFDGDGHASELGIDTVQPNLFIHNKGSLDDLRIGIESLVHPLVRCPA